MRTDLQTLRVSGCSGSGPVLTSKFYQIQKFLKQNHHVLRLFYLAVNFWLNQDFMDGNQRSWVTKWAANKSSRYLPMMQSSPSLLFLPLQTAWSACRRAELGTTTDPSRCRCCLGSTSRTWRWEPSTRWRCRPRETSTPGAATRRDR